MILEPKHSFRHHQSKRCITFPRALPITLISFGYKEMEDKKPQIEQSQLPPGLKTRPGSTTDKTKRLPSMTSLMSQVQGTSAAARFPVASATAAPGFTRGGAAKRVFKPKIPSERIKAEPGTGDAAGGASTTNGMTNGTGKTANGKGGQRNKADRKPGKGKEREMIQIKGTFEGFKVEPKKRESSSAGYGGSSGKTSSTGRFSVKKELGTNGDSFGKVNGEQKDRRRHYESDDEMQVDDQFDSELDSDNESGEKPICWQPNRTLTGAKTTVKTEAPESMEELEKRTREELKRGKLVLLPMIFGTSSGDTDYKLQVLRSGRIRLVNKNTGFCIDLVNAAPSDSSGSVKEVVEVDGDKLIRYGTLSDQDIYAPIRAPN